MTQTAEYYTIPQPDDISQQIKEDAMGSYFMMFATMALGLPLPILNLIAAIIYYYLNRSKDRFVKFHALQSLLSQIPLSMVNGVAVVWGIYLIFNTLHINNNFISYLIFLGIVNIAYIVFSLIGAVKARKGLFYYFLFFGKYSFHIAYQKKETDDTMSVNKPPF
jgi:uncharacterized membrane protein